MSILHAVHVYQPGNIPPFAENTERAQYAEYGQHEIPGDIFQNIFVHDKPNNDTQVVWLGDNVFPRLGPGGVIRYLESPSPVSTAAKTVTLNTHGIPITTPGAIQ